MRSGDFATGREFAAELANWFPATPTTSIRPSPSGWPKRKLGGVPVVLRRNLQFALRRGASQPWTRHRHPAAGPGLRRRTPQRAAPRGRRGLALHQPPDRPGRRAGQRGPRARRGGAEAQRCSTTPSRTPKPPPTRSRLLWHAHRRRRRRGERRPQPRQGTASCARSNTPPPSPEAKLVKLADRSTTCATSSSPPVHWLLQRQQGISTGRAR